MPKQPFPKEFCEILDYLFEEYYDEEEDE